MRWRFAAALLGLCLLPVLCRAEDWPSFHHDYRRSGVSGEQLKLPLKCAWVFRSAHRPQPAWPAEPAKQDFWHRHFDLRPTLDFDRAFAVVGAGQIIYFGSSADDKVYALDARTGTVKWTFFTEGPIRLAPTVVGDKVYVGSDDGCVYCLRAGDGKLLWKYAVNGQSHMVCGNGRMISLWPVRSSVVADSDRVYFAAGLFPQQGAYLIALHSDTGEEIWKRKIGISPQGYMLASAEYLYVPTGRTNPVIFSRRDGKQLGELPSNGGAYALLCDEVLVAGPGRGPKQLVAGNTQTKDTVATFPGRRLIIRGDMAYMQAEADLAAFNRKRYLQLSWTIRLLREQRARVERKLKSSNAQLKPQLQQQVQQLTARIAELTAELEDCYHWRKPSAYTDSMILAGAYLFVGGQDKVAAVRTQDGSVLWSAEVQGRAACLSVINGSLYVSTDTGRIYCFRNGQIDTRLVREPQANSPSYPSDTLSSVHARAAETIIEQADLDKGYCLVLGAGDGRLAYELARRTQWKIVAIEADPEKVAKARQILDRAGLYGRVVIHQRHAEQLPYPSYFANVIVSDEVLLTGRMSYSAEQIYRLVRPCGGMIAIARRPTDHAQQQMLEWGRQSIPGWHVEHENGLVWGLARRGKLPGSGQWTHAYAEPGNSACSQDRLVGGRMQLQWFGQPGPRRMIDRHHRNVPPLYKDGRLFVPGDCVVFAVDAYNGTILWEREVPNSRRLGVFLDCSNMVVDEQCLYIAAGQNCYGFDVRSGRQVRCYQMPQLCPGDPHQWGYLAYQDKILFASGCRKGASYTQTSYEADNALWYRNMKLVVSSYLFALDKQNGKLLWKYKDGLVLNTTLAIGSGRLYFIETHSPAALASKARRMPVKTLFNGGDQFLVALDITTGTPIYKIKLDVSHFEEPVYLNYAQEVVLLSGSRLEGTVVRYYYDAFDAATGRILWQTNHDSGLPADGGHGEYNRHPTIIGNIVYAWPYAYELATGRRIEGWKFDRRGHGCGGVSASAYCMFWRGYNPWMYDLRPGGGPSRLNTVTRPGCWINIIPAGGLVLIPEASSGCTCGYPLQTSMAFVPQQLQDQFATTVKPVAINCEQGF